MSGVAINLGGPGGRHSSGAVVPLSTADNLQDREVQTATAKATQNSTQAHILKRSSPAIAKKEGDTDAGAAKGIEAAQGSAATTGALRTKGSTKGSELLYLPLFCQLPAASGISRQPLPSSHFCSYLAANEVT